MTIDDHPYEVLEAVQPFRLGDPDGITALHGLGVVPPVLVQRVDPLGQQRLLFYQRVAPWGSLGDDRGRLGQERRAEKGGGADARVDHALEDDVETDDGDESAQTGLMAGRLLEDGVGGEVIVVDLKRFGYVAVAEVDERWTAEEGCDEGG
jgi:hypothetical protein